MTDARAFGMSPSEQEEALVRIGAPRDKAKRAAFKQLVTIEQPHRETVSLPLTITLPWSTLVSDNKRYSATIRSGKPLLVLSVSYREAKDRIQGIARRAVQDHGPELGPIQLEGKVYLPDHRRHDVSNFCKIAHDSLEGIVYANDSQIVWLSWQKMGIDQDRPRAEVTVQRLTW